MDRLTRFDEPLPETTPPDPADWGSLSAPEVLAPLLGRRFACPACGAVHVLRTRRIETSETALARSGELLEGMGFAGQPVVLFDTRTYAACGPALTDGLARFSPRPMILQGDDLHADERLVGSLLIAMSDDPPFLVSCGSGCLTDTTRYVALRCRLPFVSVATAASMDGYASSNTPLIVGGFKISYPGKAPEAILSDPRVLAKAPRAMTAAGFGDVLAKIVALLDWKLARDLEGESYCPLVADLVDKAVGECLALAGDLAGGSPSAVARLLDVLSLTGVAMQMMGTSRPASGAEHHISHLLEMRDIQRGRHGSLHGDKVGIGTLVSMAMYLRMFGDGALPVQRPTLPAAAWEREVRRVYGPLADEAIAKNAPEPPSGAAWEAQRRRLARSMDEYGYAAVRSFRTLLPKARDDMAALGGPTRPDQLGYGPEDTFDAICFGKEVRPKFTLLRLAERFGWLYDLGREIADGLPRGVIY